MEKEKNGLDQFIAKLLSDDGTLKKFLADPTNGGQEHGITKAERAVLRRVTAHLSNKSKNGYGIDRGLGSYRRSLRLLQNVLHKHAASHSSMLTSTDGLETYSFHIYITGDPNNPGAPYDNPSVAYTDYVTFLRSGDFTTVGEVMNFNPPINPSEGDTDTVNVGAVNDSHGNLGNLSYKAVYMNNAWYIIEYSLSNFSSSINGNYTLPLLGATGKDREPFWFFSLNGNAISPNSNQGYSKSNGVIEGDDGESFQKFLLNGSTNIVWQPIAPDMDYGFGPCFPTPYTPIVLGVPILEKNVVNVGQPFYTNIVTNVQIPTDATQALISLNPDGSGDIRTDDDVTIKFLGTKGSYTYYMDYSNGCSGRITQTAPVDILSGLQSDNLLGDIVTITTIYADKCGGKISSSGYFLAFEK
jgi:hypothetical protein